MPFFGSCSRNAVLDCSARFARSARIAPWSPPTSSSLADDKACLLVPPHRGGARSGARSSTTFETTLSGRMIRGVTVTPWLTLSAVGRCSSSAAAARPSRAGILAAESDAHPVRSPSSSEESCQTPLRPALRSGQRHRSVPESNPCRFSSPARCLSTAIGRSRLSIFLTGRGHRA